MKRLLSLLLCLSILGVSSQADARWYRDGYYDGYYNGPRYGYYNGGVVADVGTGVGAAAEGVGRGAANIIDSVLPW